MKIGIFGDSFAHPVDLQEHFNSISWVNILKEKYDITNYAMSGSGTYFSFQEFSNHHTDYDKIIFLSGPVGRVFLPEHMKLDLSTLPNPELNDRLKLHYHFANLGIAERMLSLVEAANGSLMDRKRLAAIRDYFMYVMNPAEQTTYSKLMAKEVQSIRPDALVRFTATVPGDDIWSVSLMELAHWGETVTSVNQKNLFDIRQHHLTNQNNVILANKMDQWITNGTPLTLPLSDFVKPTEPLEKYYIKQWAGVLNK